MSNCCGWFAVVRAVLELLYFSAGIVIAVAAVLALKQIKITKQIANTNAKREAIKLAAEQCRYYAEHIVPLLNSLLAEYSRLGLRFLGGKPEFAIQGGEIVSANFDIAALDAEIPRIGTPLVAFLNALEAFAIPFAAGVADDDLGYQETAMAFCQVVRIYMPAFYQMRRIKAARFESAIKLYDLWNKRLAGQALAPVMETLEELVKAAREQRIKPAGTEDHD